MGCGNFHITLFWGIEEEMLVLSICVNLSRTHAYVSQYKDCYGVLPLAVPILTLNHLHCSNRVCPGHQHVLTTGVANTDKT